MKHAHFLLTTVLLAAMPAAALAQEPGTPAKPATQAAAPVLIPVAANVPISDTSGATIGSIQDHVIDCASGRIVSLVVEVRLQPEGTKTVLVPYTRFGWDGAKKALVARASPAELAAMPEHAKDDAKQPDARARPAGADTKLPREVPASDLVACSVKAQEDELGSVHSLFMDPEQGAIAMVLVLEGKAAPGVPPRPGGECLAVPWKAMKFRLEPSAAEGTEENGCLVLAKQKDELAAAPRIQGGDPRVLADAELYDKIHRFYGVSPSVAPRRAN